VNGFRFRSKDSERSRRTQHSGVVVSGGQDDDQIDYYGVLTDIIEIHYFGQNHVVLFKCNWFDVNNRDTGYKVDKYGFISVNTAKRLITQDQDPFILASQAEQVFYVPDNTTEGWKIVVRTPPRDYYDMGDADTGVIDDDLEAYQNDHSSTQNERSLIRTIEEVDNVNWVPSNKMITVDATHDGNQMSEDEDEYDDND